MRRGRRHAQAAPPLPLALPTLANAGPPRYGRQTDLTTNSKPVVAVYTDKEPQPIPGQGWFTSCLDTEGNAFSLFQEDRSVKALEQPATAGGATRR